MRKSVLALASALSVSAAFAQTPPAESPAALVERGYDHFYNIEYPEAIADFDQAIRINPAYANAYTNRAVARRASGDKAGAESDTTAAQKLAGTER